MGRMLRMVRYEFEPFELLWRCAQRRFLLRPGSEANRRIVGVLGQAARRFGDDVRVYFAGGTCNHIHIVAAFRSAEVKADWVGYVRGNLSKELGALFDWPGSHWERRSSDIPIADDEALYARLVYVAGQAVRAGLVRRPVDWPGVPWIQAVTEGRSLVGVWYDRTRLYRMRQAWAAKPEGRRGRWPVLADVAQKRVFELAPVPMWAGLSEGEQRARWCEVVAAAEARWPVAGKVLGRAALVTLDPHGRPEESAGSSAPAVHASSRDGRQAWWAVYLAFAETYRRAMKALRSGIDGFGFPPEGCRPVRMMPAPGG